MEQKKSSSQVAIRLMIEVAVVGFIVVAILNKLNESMTKKRDENK